MSYRTQGRISHQISSLRKQFDNAPGLPFSGWLVAEQVQRLLQEAGVDFRERLYTPSRTLWIFLSQVFSSDHSCREAVARFIAFLLASGKAPCAAETSSYCEARQKLPEAVFARLVQETGRQPHDEAPEKWLLQGRRIKVVDGTTVSMPDTPENQQAFPQSRTQRPGVGFPIARLVVVFSLAVGTAVDMAMGKYKGKQTGEISLFRVLKNSLLPGEIILGDRVYSSFFDIVMLQRRGVDVAETMLATIAQHRVGDRPDRVEPRAVKRRPKPHDLLTIPRHEARTRLLRTASA